MKPWIISHLLIQRTGTTAMARILGRAGTPITQATLSAIAGQVWDFENRLVSWGPTALTIATVVFNSLVQQDPRWEAAGGDEQGYNFLWEIPALALSMPGNRMRADVKFTPVTGEQFIVPFEGQVVPVFIP